MKRVLKVGVSLFFASKLLAEPPPETPIILEFRHAHAANEPILNSGKVNWEEIDIWMQKAHDQFGADDPCSLGSVTIRHLEPSEEQL